VLSGTAKALTVAREWYQRDGWLYFWPPGTAGPSVFDVEVTCRRWAFDLRERAHIHVVGVRLHAASVNMADSRHCVLDGIRARYTSFDQYYRGGFNRDRGINIEAQGVGIAVGGAHNTIRNSIISRCTGDGISIWGASNTVENCVVYDCDTSATDCAPVTCTGVGHVIQSNTLFNAGRSILLHRHVVKGVFRHNLLYNAGLLCCDLGMTYTYQTDSKGTEIAYNVLHHHFGKPPGGVGIYIDDMSKGHIIHHNLVYNTPEALAMNPPDSQRNIVFNNTMLGTLAGIGMASRRQNLSETRIFNNIFNPHISMTVVNSEVVFLTNNMVNASLKNFVDPANGDYTLRADSAAVDAGMLYPPHTDGFTGDAPDLGAFERGKQPWTAGSTIPEDTWGQLAPW
jgi:parallel beta-helix repeat protein